MIDNNLNRFDDAYLHAELLTVYNEDFSHFMDYMYDYVNTVDHCMAPVLQYLREKKEGETKNENLCD